VWYIFGVVKHFSNGNAVPTRNEPWSIVSEVKGDCFGAWNVSVGVIGSEECRLRLSLFSLTGMQTTSQGSTS